MKYYELINEVTGYKIPKLLELHVGYRKSSFAEMKKLNLYASCDKSRTYNPVSLIFCENCIINKLPVEYQLVRNLDDLTRLIESYANKDKEVELCYIVLEDNCLRDSVVYTVNDTILMSNKFIFDIKPVDYNSEFRRKIEEDK